MCRGAAVLLLLCTFCAPTLADDEVPEGQKATRPCPALLMRIERWVDAMAKPMAPEARKALRRRLASAGQAAVPRMGAELGPTLTALLAAEKSTQESARRGLLAKLLDLIDLLGQSRSPEAYAPLVRAAGSERWYESLRKRAIAALGVLGQPRALAVLDNLRKTSPALSYDAGKAILAIAHVDALPYWVALLESPRQNLSVGAHELLKTWSGESYKPDRATWTRYLKEYPEGFARLPGYKAPE